MGWGEQSMACCEWHRTGGWGGGEGEIKGVARGSGVGEGRVGREWHVGAVVSS